MIGHPFDAKISMAEHSSARHPSDTSGLSSSFCSSAQNRIQYSSEQQHLFPLGSFLAANFVAFSTESSVAAALLLLRCVDVPTAPCEAFSSALSSSGPSGG